GIIPYKYKHYSRILLDSLFKLTPPNSSSFIFFRYIYIYIYIYINLFCCSTVVSRFFFLNEGSISI
ncbi:MAG: hypothetical protein N7Q72_03770, partial [Spiroplasma sp. Tabriz.8]|nr:hypothetical protein [Spiroplasma sp. Tabriz.8]